MLVTVLRMLNLDDRGRQSQGATEISYISALA